MHVNPTSAPTYLYPSRQRMSFYPPTAPPSSYYTPWLWLDGDPAPGYNTGTWSTHITNRLNQPSPLTASIWGEYNTHTNSGTINVRFRNDSNATINANVLFVITEDNIAYTMPNGDGVHNHVARQFIPDHIGTAVSFNSGDSITVSYPFTIQSNWNAQNIEFVAIIQTPVLVGSTKEILQGAKIGILDLAGVEELQNHPPVNSFHLRVLPNPCVNQARFSFTLPAGSSYQINIFDASGRAVKTINGVATGNNDVVNCDLKNSVASGVYFYRFESTVSNKVGKIIVK